MINVSGELTLGPNWAKRLMFLRVLVFRSTGNDQLMNRAGKFLTMQTEKPYEILDFLLRIDMVYRREVFIPLVSLKTSSYFVILEEKPFCIYNIHINVNKRFPLA